MTITNTTDRVKYSVAASAANPTFVVPFKFLANDDLVVRFTLTSSGAITTFAEGTTADQTPTQYTVTGAGVESGGSIQLHDGEVAAAGTLEIIRVVSPKQENDYQAGGVFSAESHEDSLDKLTMLAHGSISTSTTDPTDWDAGPPRHGETASNPRQIKNVADGVDSKDAVNKAQLDAVQTTGGNLPGVTSSDNADMLIVASGAWATKNPSETRDNLTLNTDDDVRFDKLGIGVAASGASGDAVINNDLTVSNDLTVTGRISASSSSQLGIGSVDPTLGTVHITTTNNSTAPTDAADAADDLVIEDAENAGLTITGAKTGNIYFADSVKDVGKIVYDHESNADTMTFTTNAEEMLVLDGPNDKIDVKENKITNLPTALTYPSADDHAATKRYVDAVAGGGWVLVETQTVSGDPTYIEFKDDLDVGWENYSQLKIVCTDYNGGDSEESLWMYFSHDGSDYHGGPGSVDRGYWWHADGSDIHPNTTNGSGGGGGPQNGGISTSGVSAAWGANKGNAALFLGAVSIVASGENLMFRIEADNAASAQGEGFHEAEAIIYNPNSSAYNEYSNVFYSTRGSGALAGDNPHKHFYQFHSYGGLVTASTSATNNFTVKGIRIGPGRPSNTALSAPTSHMRKGRFYLYGLKNA